MNHVQIILVAIAAILAVLVLNELRISRKNNRRKNEIFHETMGSIIDRMRDNNDWYGQFIRDQEDPRNEKPAAPSDKNQGDE